MLGRAQQEDLLLPEPREVAQLLGQAGLATPTLCVRRSCGHWALGCTNHSSTPSCMQGFVGSDITFRWAAVQARRAGHWAGCGMIACEHDTTGFVNIAIMPSQ
jgi:hypothetical protein